MNSTGFLRGTALLGLTLLVLAGSMGQVFAFGLEGIRRDTFPVFNDPKMLTVAEAEKAGTIQPRDAVIGIASGREARAYPITVMGNHELGNDTIDGIPIAITW